MEKIIIDKCTYCNEKHIFDIKKEGLVEDICINLACENIQRYIRLRSFHFSGEANILRNNSLDIENNIINRFGNDDFEIKKERIMHIESYILVINEYTEFLNEIFNSYIMGYTYPFIVSTCTLLERILNVMIEKLKKYNKADILYKKVHKSTPNQNWDLMINILFDWGYLTIEQKKLFKKFESYRNQSVHFNKGHLFKESEKIILENFSKLLKSLFGIFERKDIVKFIPGEFWIKPSKMTDPFVKEFFIPNGSMSSYIGNIYEEYYSEEGVKSGKLNEEEFFDLKEKNKGFKQSKNLIFENISLYGYNVFYRLI